MSNLVGYDFIVAVDASGSMGDPGKGGKSLYENAAEDTIAVAREAAKHDEDGAVDVIVFNSSVKLYEDVTPEKVAQVFKEQSPRGGTDTAGAVEAAVKLHFDRKAEKPDQKSFVFVITDGVPNDEAALQNTLIKATETMTTDDELTFLFVQSGTNSAASAFLARLDDELVGKGAKFDIVDAKTAEESEKFSTVIELIETAIAD